MRKVFIGLMAFAGGPESPTSNMIRDFAREATARGWAITGADSIRNSILPVARNAMVADFLAGDATDLLFVDDDNYTDAKTLVRVVEAPVDCIGLAIRARSEAVEWNVRWLHEREHLIAVDPATGQPSDLGFLEVEKVGTGILRLSRACLERMVEHYADDWYHTLSTRSNKAVALFEFVRRDRLIYGEDIVFCEKWRAIGGTVWIDPIATTHHIGKTLFSGAIGSWLRDPNRSATEINLTGLHELEKAVGSLAQSMGVIQSQLAALPAA